MKKIIFILLVVSISCTEATKELTNLWVHSYAVACDGVDGATCLQIQESETIDPMGWQLFSDTIECFKYEEGFLYKVHVVKKTLPEDQVPADGSAIQYKLVNVVSKVEQNSVLLNGKWILSKIEGDEVDATALSDIPYLEFNLSENAVRGTDGCNRMNGNIKFVDNSNIEFLPFATTRMMCEAMEIPDSFGVKLSTVTTYRIDSDLLTFTGNKNEELLTFTKAD